MLKITNQTYSVRVLTFGLLVLKGFIRHKGHYITLPLSQLSNWSIESLRLSEEIYTTISGTIRLSENLLKNVYCIY